MKKTAILLMLILMLSKIMGFVKDIVLSYFYGTSGISDAYLISLTIPSVIFGIIGVGIATGYIPMYSSIEEKKGQEKANSYSNNLINILIIISTVIFIFGQVFTAQIVKAFASGFEGETLILAIKFTKISLVGIYFTGIIYIFQGFLQLKDKYIVSSLVGIPLNLFIVLSILISYKTDIIVMAIGSVVAVCAQLLMLLPFVRKEGYRYKFIIDIKDEYIKKMVFISLPIIIGSSVDQINILIDRTLASSITVGGISALNYASKLNGFVQGLFVVSIATVMYPMISKMAAEMDIDGIKESLAEAISSINLLVIPITIGAMIFAQPVVKLLFGRGAFDASAISMTSTTLFFYSIGMLAFGLRDILSRVFYSMQDTKTPTIIAIIAVVINIILNIVLSRIMGIGGLALATSISAITCVILLFKSLRKKIGSFGMKNIFISSVKILIASIIMGVISKISFELLLKLIDMNLALIIAVGIGALTYGILIYVLKVEEVNIIISTLKAKLKKNN